MMLIDPTILDLELILIDLNWIMINDVFDPFGV